jgi:hypothetical protein
MKQIVLTVLMTAAMATRCLAGDIPTVGAPSPPPPEIKSSTVSGDIPISGLTDQFSTEALSALLAVIGMVS